MAFDWLAFLTFALITSYTPGPNNISCATFSMNLGYKKTLKYILGIMIGFFIVMFLAGSFTELITTTFPKFEIYLKYIGATYIFWLAYSIFKTSKKSKDKNKMEAKFFSGFFLQIMNPKVIFYGVSIFTGFLNPIISNIFHLLLVCFLLMMNACIALNFWALFGAGMKRVVKNKKTSYITNIIMAILLVYSGITIILH